MKVYLVQHGQAKSKDEDPTRGLTDLGIAALAMAAAFCGRQASMSVETVYHSGKQRALQTAGVFAEQLGPVKGVVDTDGLAPMDDPSIWAERLGEQDQDVMLVGHLPHLAKLTARLLGAPDTTMPVRFHNGGVVCLQRSEDGAWSVDWIVVPELLA